MSKFGMDVCEDTLRDQTLHRSIETYFGIDRLTQEQTIAIDSILDGNDVFISTRTGSGKSICYQALPLANGRKNIVLVSCPLLSIMQEQVSWLVDVGIKASYIGKCPTEDESIRKGEMEIVYGSPEQIVGNQEWRRVWQSEI